MKRTHLALLVSISFFIISGGFSIYEVFHRGYISTVDLAVYRQAGYDLFHNIPLYSNSFGTNLNVRLGYVYPPITSLVFVPFSLVSMNLTKWIWTVLSIAELLTVIKISFSKFIESNKKYEIPFWLIISGLMLWVSPMYNNLIYGQIDILILTIVLTDLVFLQNNKRPKWLPQGLLTGIAAAFKLVPAIFILYFLITADFKRLKNSLIAFASLTLFGFIIMPSDSSTYWFHYLENTGRNDNAWYFTNQSLDGILRRLSPNHWTDIWIPLMLAILIFGMISAIRAHKNNDEFLAIILVGTTGIIISPISWIHECVWVIPIIGYILGSGKKPSRIIFSLIYYIFATLELLQIGKRILEHNGSRITGDLLENCLGLSLILMLLILSTINPIMARISNLKSTDVDITPGMQNGSV